MVLGDVSGRFGAIVRAYDPEIVFLDVHDYTFLAEAVRTTRDDPQSIRMLAIHDCGRGLCNPHMTLRREDPQVTSATGVWERHVLAEAFEVADPLDSRLDALESATHRLTIFDTTHGLGVLLPRASQPSR
jgi:hypothetical protein